MAHSSHVLAAYYACKPIAGVTFHNNQQLLSLQFADAFVRAQSS
jgi:hypothetical protein